MSTAETPKSPFDPNPFRLWGTWAILVGAVALCLVCYQIFGPSFEPKTSAGQQIGEIAGEMKRSAWRAFLGLKQPEPVAEPVRVSSFLPVAGPILGVIAILLSVIAAFAREHWRLPTYGATLGVAAIVFQFVWWMALLIAGVLLLVSIIENIGDFFTFG